MAWVAIGNALVDGFIIGGLIGSTVLVVGGTIALIIAAVDKHNQKMQSINNLREEAVQKLKNQHEKELHEHEEFQKVFKLFQLEVQQAKILITEAEYTDKNGRKIKGYNGRFFLFFVNLKFHFSTCCKYRIT